MFPGKITQGSARGVLRPLSTLAALALFVALFFGALHARASGTLPSPGDYTVDVAGSSVGFGVTEFLVNNVDGKFTTFAGKVKVGDTLGNSQIEATVNVASIDTGVHMRNEHLLAPEYFDAARFPQMQFTSKAIWGTPDNFGIKGNLTIKGVTKEVVFSARIMESGIVVAETKIDRSSFGMTAGGTIKNEVRLRLEIRLQRASP